MHTSGEIDPREELVRRVANSITFEKSPKLREFLLYVCRCALDDQPAAATELQVGINVFRRPAGYNPNDDNIVRSQARLLRLKLEHHFAHEGHDEPVVIVIPKGRYLPSFENRAVDPVAQPASRPDVGNTDLHLESQVPRLVDPPVERQSAHAGNHKLRMVGLCSLTLVIAGLAVARFTELGAPIRHWLTVSAASSAAPPQTLPFNAKPHSSPIIGMISREHRIIAGRTGAPVVDSRGQRWQPDEFYEGGLSRNGPSELFPPSSNPDLFKTIREGASEDSLEPQSQSIFRYDIPVPAGVYELRLYFADPARKREAAIAGDGQNLRHFRVNLNGRPLLSGFDAIADAGSAPVDVRAFKDVSPAADGQVHLEFVPDPERPFLSALELTPGTPGKLSPIRISPHKSDFVDADGVHWSADNYFINGQTMGPSSESGQELPELYSRERIGNFSYAIPVPSGSYTVKLHFLEGYFGASSDGACSKGIGCRVFDVSCNGSMLLHDFDIYRAAGGAFRPVVRTFHGLQPNGQGKLLISFSSKVNYAEVRAIEVLDEAR